MSSFNLKIVSFNKSLYSKSIDMVVLPGAFGDISITSMGRSFAYVLTSGVIYVFEGNEKKRFFIQGGRFLSSSNEVVVSIEGDFFDLDTLKEQEIHKNASVCIRCKEKFYPNRDPQDPLQPPTREQLRKRKHEKTCEIYGQRDERKLPV